MPLKDLEQRKQYSKQYYIENREKIIAKSKRYYIENKEKVKQYRIDNAEKIVTKKKQYRIDNVESISKYNKKYIEQWYPNNKEYVLKYQRNYRKTETGKESKCKIGAKRRKLGFIPMNKFFVGSEAHHIDEEHVVYIPKAIHQSIRHNVWTWHNMDAINILSMLYI